MYLVKRMMHTSYGISLQASTDIRSETNSRLLYASCELYASKVFHTREIPVPNLQLACFYKKSFVGVLYNMSSNTSFGMNPSNHSSSAVSFTFRKSPGVRPVAVELT